VGGVEGWLEGGGRGREGWRGEERRSWGKDLRRRSEKHTGEGRCEGGGCELHFDLRNRVLEE